MHLYARVNILGGRAVRLPHGDVHEAISLEADPLARALGWVEKGASRLHIVDLDAAAYGNYSNRPLIHDIIEKSPVSVQVAGGIRTPNEADELIAKGARRVVMGTAAIEEQVMVWELCRTYPNQIAVGLDVLPSEELVVRGWLAHSGRFMEEVLIELSSAGVSAFLISEAGRDALSEPPNLSVLRRAMDTVDQPIIAAGGARSTSDLEALFNLEHDGKSLAGVVVGREVTEGRFTMEQAREILRDS